MTHRSRIRILGLGMLAVALLTAPLIYQFATWGYLLQHLLVAVLGGLIVRSSFAQGDGGRWPQGLGVLLFGYYTWNLTDGLLQTVSSFSFNLTSVTAIASAAFVTWFCGLAAYMLLSSSTTKRSLESTTPIPATLTSMGFGAVAALYGVSGILEPGADGFISTGVAIGFAATLLGLGVMILRGKQSELACYGIGVSVAAFAGWTFFTNPAFDFLIGMTGRLQIYGLIGALVVMTFLGSVLIGSEVAASAKTVPTKK